VCRRSRTTGQETTTPSGSFGQGGRGAGESRIRRGLAHRRIGLRSSVGAVERQRRVCLRRSGPDWPGSRFGLRRNKRSVGVGDVKYVGVLARTALALIVGLWPGLLRASCRLGRAVVDEADQDGEDGDGECDADDQAGAGGDPGGCSDHDRGGDQPWEARGEKRQCEQSEAGDQAGGPMMGASRGDVRRTISCPAAVARNRIVRTPPASVRLLRCKESDTGAGTGNRTCPPAFDPAATSRLRRGNTRPDAGIPTLGWLASRCNTGAPRTLEICPSVGSASLPLGGRARLAWPSASLGGLPS
jgi:hypothetical protein